MAFCGLRVSEACSLTAEAIFWSTETPYLRFRGKRGRERIVPLNLEAQDALRNWLEMLGTNRSPYVFPNRTGGRLSRKTVWAMLNRLCKRAGIRHISPHALRHYFGTELANQGVPVERIRELMGHASITTSQIYITVSSEQKRAAVEKIDRRSRLSRWWSRQRNRHFRFFGESQHKLIFGAPQTVGRKEEIHQLQENVNKGIDTLLIGPIGSGKSHLLTLLKGEKIIRIKAMSPIKDSVIDLAEELFQRGVLKTDNITQPSEGKEA